MKTSKEEADNIINEARLNTIYKLKTIEEQIKALKERDKQWEDAIDKCTPDGSVKTIKKHLA